MTTAQGPMLARKRALGRAAFRAAEPASILVGLLCPIGDTLFATPALAALRLRFPAARIDVLVYRSNANILTGNPDINDQVIYDPSSSTHPLARYVHGV